MKELSLHILDIAQNSTKAGASHIEIHVTEDARANRLSFSVIDNGCGIKKSVLATITNPFSTSRTTRRVGLGLSLLQFAAEQCGGGMAISSEEGVGTTVTATFQRDHIDRAPLGDMATTLMTLIMGNPAIDFSYIHRVNERVFECHTADIKRELGDVPITDISVTQFLTEYVQQHIDNLYREEDTR